MSANVLSRIPPGLLSGLVFFTVVLAGSLYIIFSKLYSLPALYVTSVPVLIMVGYALLLGLARFFRLRDDQSGDNLYYMGFLFTLTSLAMSLFQFSPSGSAEQIVQNFGVAIASTIAGISLRIFFNQMRRDPVEVEHIARLELADASRKVRRELDSTALEFSYFRRSVQQSVTDMIQEMNDLLKEGKDKFITQLGDFASTSSKPIEDATKRSGDSIEQYNRRISEQLDKVATQVTSESERLSKSTAAIINSMNTVASKLQQLQTPDNIIEIKLNPMVQGLSRAVNNFGKSTEAQAQLVENNLVQTQALAHSMAELLAFLKAAESQRQTNEQNARALHKGPDGPVTITETF